MESADNPGGVVMDGRLKLFKLDLDLGLDKATVQRPEHLVLFLKIPCSDLCHATLNLLKQCIMDEHILGLREGGRGGGGGGDFIL